MNKTRLLNTETVFLIHLDILGFEELARRIAESSKTVSERKVREDFIRTIDQKIMEVEQRGELIGKKAGKGDDWLFAVSSLDLVFKTIFEILNHNTEYVGYEKVPLEIAVGNGQYDEWAKLNGSNLICESSTIDFLKTLITDFYRKWYKAKFSCQVTSSFVLFTESIHKQMGYFEKELCERVECSRMAEGKSNISFYVADMPRVIQRGKLFCFLQKIGKSNSSWFHRIDCAYVPPNEYESILDNLEHQKAVFLIGDPEIGKTFTAARILWEYCLKGYSPVWNSGADDQERALNRKKLCEFEISDHSVTYFEDPFGKRKFEDREELRRIITNILLRIQRLDARVIISSREQIFREFEREILSQRDLSEFIVEMRLMKPSYSVEKMTTILLNWAREFDCRWLSIEALKTAILFGTSKRLTTPLSLWDFAFSSRDCINPAELDELIKEKSKAVKASFAEEIAQMPQEKILFLSLISILGNSKPIIIKTVYHSICEHLRLNDSLQTSFEALEKQFVAKVTLSNKGSLDREYYVFTHPSYEEGVINSWNRDEVKNLILQTLNLLVKDTDPLVRGCCGLSLITNFEEVSFKDEARTLIKAILYDKKALTRLGIALGLDSSFKNIPITIGLEFVRLLMKDRNGEIRAQVISTVASNFGSIPFKDGIEIVSLALEDRSARVRFEAVRCVKIYCDSFPIALALRALEVNEKLCNYGGWFISYLSGFMYEDLKKKIEERTTKKAPQS